jgi:hypothetical protein
LVQQLGSDGRRQERLAARGGCDSVDDLARGRTLQQVAAGAGEHRVGDVGRGRRHRQHDHARERGHRRDLARRLDSADARHVEVHDHHVRVLLLDQLQRELSVGRLADDVDPSLFEQASQARAIDLVIVDE